MWRVYAHAPRTYGTYCRTDECMNLSFSLLLACPACAGERKRLMHGPLYWPSLAGSCNGAVPSPSPSPSKVCRRTDDADICVTN